MLSKFNWTGYLELQHVLNRLSSHVITEQAGSEQAIFINLELQQVLNKHLLMLLLNKQVLNRLYTEQAGSEQAIFSNLELQQVLELQQSMLAQSSSMLNQFHVN